MSDSTTLTIRRSQLRAIIQRALEEDLPWGDVTSLAFVPAESRATGHVVSRETGTICGLEVAALVFEELDPSLSFTAHCEDGDRVARDTTVARVRGTSATILAGERTALNLMQRMSGVATETARYVSALGGTHATIVDTRKTAPGLRLLDKYAVRCGGGSNHRFSLSDGVLIKDNHLAAAGVEDGAGLSALAAALRAARRRIPHTTRIEVEVDRLEQIEPALAGGADIILLDNMEPSQLRQAVELVAGRAVTEASGGITLDTVREVALTGVDLISVGALTHSVRALDIGLDVTLE